MPTEFAIDLPKLWQTVVRLTECLTRGDYIAFCESARRSRLSPQEIDTVIREYGRRIVPLPTAAYALLDVVAVRDSIPARWRVVVPLWTEQEGRSDLSLELTVEDVDGGVYAVEIDDLHVL